MPSFNESLKQAHNLTLQGRLAEATQLIQAELGMHPPAIPEPEQHNPNDEIQLGSSQQKAPAGQPPFVWRAQPAEAVDISFREEPSPPLTASACFTLHTFQSGVQRYNYRLFVPSRTGEERALPVVVMLHGCKQNADDFARGTAMNIIAEREKFIVVYPDQVRTANSMGCWNWFEPQHQQRGQGEPAMIATLASHVVAKLSGDASRVYIAGLSAGGAMAALTGQLYPEIFAAVGVHSGLTPGAAHNLASALQAMRKGPNAKSKRAIGLPIIVFQGTADQTVAPANAHALIKSEIDAFEESAGVLRRIQEEITNGADRNATRERWMNAHGTCRIESWSVKAAPHAWSGGDRAGSFTDPRGPSASEAMFSFFWQHFKPGDGQ